MTDNLTLIILPHSEVVKLDLLKKTNWQYVCAISDIPENSVDEELEEIREFFGEKSCCNTPLDDYRRCSECGEPC